MIAGVCRMMAGAPAAVGSGGGPAQKVVLFFFMALLYLLLVSVTTASIRLVRKTQRLQAQMGRDPELDVWTLNHLLCAGQHTLEQDRGRHAYAVAYLSIVPFQRYQALYGRSSGQRLLVVAAQALSECVRENGELCARTDGAQFVLLLSSEHGDFVKRTQSLALLAEEYIAHTLGDRIEVRAGLRLLPPKGAELRQAVACARQAISFLRPGGERVKLFDDTLEHAVQERRQRREMLDTVPLEGNFTVYYQAKVDVRTRQVVGAEALVRFLDPTAGGAVRAPGFFVPYYEQTGRVVELDFFVLRQVCRMLRRRLDRGEPVVPVSCNFSRRHFVRPGFAERIGQLLQESGVPRELIEVEVPQSAVMEKFQQREAEETLDRLHAQGVRLSIDNFSAARSSLGVMEKIPASVVKLDRSFLLRQKDRERHIRIMRRVVHLAQDLGAQVVCSGVETKEDVARMEEIGAHIAQGYRYAKPVPEPEFEARLTQSVQAT